jgi:uncharacterized membrane protein YdbT with pleckstrin-like domain
MGYLESLLGQGERVVFQTRHHWTAFLGRVLLHGLLLVVGLALAVGGNVLGGGFLNAWVPDPTQQLAVRIAIPVALVVYPILALAVWWVHWRADQFIVTNYRVVHVEGIFSKSVIDSSLEKVNDVLLYQSLLGRLLDFGTVEILTGSEIGINKLARIGQPLAFKKAMLDAKQELEGTSRGRQASVPELIDQLALLRDRGVLTEEEFQSKKTELLRQMQA